MFAFEQILLAIHVGAGSVALIVGSVALSAPKGGVVHRAAGRVFLRLLIAVLLSAVVLLPFRGNPFLASLTVFSAYLAFSGVRVLRQRRRLEPTRLDWVAAATALGLGATLAALTWIEPPIQGPAVAASVLAGLAVYGAYDLASMRWRLRLRWPNLWLYEHIWKMVGAFTSVVAAFSGSVLKLFSPPWRQLWPSLVAIPLVVLLVIYYHRRLSQGVRLPGAHKPAAKARTQMSGPDPAEVISS